MSDEDVDEVVKQLNDAIPKDAGGSNDTVVVTEKAAEKLKDILKEQKKEGYGLRIEVLPGGCSGFQYAFDFENEKKENDTVIEVSGVNFFVDNESIKMLRGARIDYVDSLQGAGFKISNPNAKSTCGCGQSFS
ncbi:iron-sulfur cluster insertion protein ErpA [Candidatus Woesearchaeota archaeon]|nr:iron-sulfur cluster insertion protein ErpA [Candidatus Woesearchaeota archaeon]